jgi:SNF2 family DNA or RNA helicase
VTSTLSLHDYQVVARDFLRERDRAALFLDMGLGKTATSLSALEPRHLPALVVAPKRVAETVWVPETRLWRPDLKATVAAGRPADRARELASSADIVALGRDNLGDLARVRRAKPFRTVIIDELSGFKNYRSARWKATRKFIRDTSVRHVWGLTGTPTPNGLLDLWAQIALLDDGERLGRNITTYRSRYFTPGRQLPSGVITEWLLRDGADAKIHGKIEDIALSMSTAGRIDLPPVTENHVVVQLPPVVKRRYRELKTHLVVDLRDVLGGEIHTAANAAVLTSKLSQITAGFMYVDDADLRDGKWAELHREKISAVREVVDGTGSPVLVFYRFKAEREMLAAEFKGVARDVKEPGVIDAWNRGEVPVLLAHPASAGHGLNLQHGGHTICWTSLPWSLEEWEQANKRLARQGQKHPVVIHVVRAKGTVDTIVRAALNDKSVVQTALLDHLESPV